jgi:predicted DNA-binding protein (MmcQ/YjbR family)
MKSETITRKLVEDFILKLPNAKLDYPFGESTAVYKTGDKMFALMDEKKEPVNLSLKIDPQLGVLLREKYESVLPGYHLNKKHWITVIASGQLSWQEIKDLIEHSYSLVAK